MNTMQKKFSGPCAVRGVLEKQTFLMRLRIVLCMVILILTFGNIEIPGQGVGISEVSITPDPSSILELRSSVRGFLAPRMNTAERMTLGSSSPATGLLVYDTETKSFWYWDTGWKAFASGAWGTSNQLLGMNAAGDANEYKTLLGTPNQIYVTHAPGLITLSTPQDIHIGATPTFQGLTLNGLLPNAGVYTDGSRTLTSTPPSSGTIGYWDRTGNILSPTNAGDHVTTSGNIYTTGTGTITAAGLLTGNAGATISGGTIGLNNNSNFPTNINTGTSTGPVTIGNSLTTVTLPALTPAGVVHNDATGLLSTSLIVNNDITDGTIDLTTKVTNVLRVPNGGTGVSSITANNLIYGNGTDPVLLLPPDATTGTLLMNTAGGPPSWSSLDALPATAGVLQSVNGGTGYNNYGDGQLLIGNSAGTLSRNTLAGTVNQIYVTNGDGTITLSTPQDIHTGATPTFMGLTLTGLTPNAGVYTDGSSTLTSAPPNSGTIGYWNRTGNVLSPTNSGDNVTTSGNIYTTDAGTITSAGLLTANSGATISGGAINLNSDSNFPTNINTGSSTGPVTIGNSLNTITLPAFNTAGVVHNDASGLLSTGLIVNGDITDGAIDLTTKVTGILPIANGGTNSGTALVNNRLMISRAGRIVELFGLNNGQLIVGSTGNEPQVVTMSGDITIDNAGVTTIGVGTVENGMLANDAVTSDKIADGTIVNADINANAAIDATKLIDGSVSNQELEYINTLSNNAQTQLDNIGTQIVGITTLADGRIYLGDVTNTAQEVLMSGDVTIDNTGLTTISAGAVTTGKIQDGTILNADIDAAAGIEFSKLENLPSANIILGSATNVPAAAAVSGDATIDNTGALTLANTTVAPGTYGDGTHVGTFTVDSKGRLTFAANTLITGASPVGSALTDGHIWIGDATGLASEAMVSGDITMTNTGVVTISDDAVTTGKIANGTILNEDIADATIDLTTKVTNVLPIANGGTNSGTALVNNRLMISRAGQIVELFGLNNGQMIVGSTGNEPQVVTMSGDITINNTGVTTIGAGTVENGMLVDDAVTNTKLADNSVNTSELTDGSVTTSKISDGTIVNADINANAQIDASKLIDGSVSSAELGYINSLASNAQTQLDNLGTQITGINTLADGRIYLGDNTNTAQEVLMSGDVTINNLGATTISAGAVTTGKIQDGTILNGDIANGTIDLTSKVANVLPIANGGTNSGTALVNNRLMISRAGQIVELFGLSDGQLIIGRTGNEPQVVSMSGDVTIDNSGATIVGSVGGSTAANINAATLLANAATTANTANTIVRRDASGNFTAGNITGSLLGNATTATSATTAATANNFSGSLSGDVTGIQAATVVSQVGGITAANVASGANLANAATNANTANTIVRRDASGNFTAGNITGDLLGNATTATSATTATTAGTATNFTGSLSGDVTGTQAATVVSQVGGVTAANVASGANLANAATDVNTANTIVRRDASGNFTAGNITGNLLGNATTATSAITATTSTNFTGTLAGDVTGTQGATVVSTVGGSTAVNVNAATILANAATSANTANAIVRRDASGNFDAGLITGDLSGNATTATTSTNFSGALAGDVTGTQAATVVSQVGGVTAANVASGANLANAATAANTAGTIVRRDASGNFTAGTITGTLSGNATNVSGIVAVPNGGTGASSLTDHGVLLGSGTNPVSVTGTGSAGQVLQSGGAGADPGYSNAAYPGAAGDPGSIIVSDGTNFTSAGLSTSADYLGANVTMTNAGPFYTGPSVSLPAGTWYISGTLTVRNPGGSSGALVSRLQYGGTSLSSSETYIRAGYQVSITLSGIVTFTATTTISTQAASNLAGCIIRASAFTFPTGNNASFIHAVRIGP